MITFRHQGNFDNTEKFFKKVKEEEYLRSLEKYAQAGVNALAAATPKRTGATAAAWSYEIRKTNGRYSIYWKNSNIVNGVQIAVILQYGHGTRNGGYVQGRDYINPAIQPIFDQIADEAWREVTSK